MEDRQLSPPQQPLGGLASHVAAGLAHVVERVEAAWLRSAASAQCFDLNVKGDQDEVVRGPNEPMLPTLLLRTGAHMPAVGLGTYCIPPGPDAYAATLSALHLGYRSVDTAQLYGNEADVGRALRDSGLPRGAVFLTTKLWTSQWGYDRARAAVRQSLQDLGSGYVDLLLLHAPGDPATRPDTWRALEDCLAAGEARAIGVSNFGIPHLEALAATARVAPAVNQLELSPFLQRRELVAYCRAHGMVLQAYSPLCRGARLAHPAVVEISSRLGVTPAQLLVRWSLQSGYAPLPKSAHPDRQAENLAVSGWEIPPPDMEALGALEEGLVTEWDPAATAPV